ncbi:MAG TPA: dTMP kinase [Phycisphaeraceae bacterium]
MEQTSPPPWLDKLRGRFIVFDGPDGSGKTTQFHRMSRLAEAAGVPVCPVREPGGTPVGEQIRKLLLEYRDDDHGQMDLRCEMLLFMASRAQLVAQRIRPALAEGQLVLADRFISSTLAYQGAAGGLDRQEILTVGQVALSDCWPHLVVIFDVDEKTAASRLSPLLDRMEQKGAQYHRRVRQGFLDQAKADPARHLVIDATADPDTVFQRLLHGLEHKLAANA